MALVQTLGGYYVQTELDALLAEVDSWPGEPTDEDIAALARKYGDSEWYIRMTFKCKKYRQEANWRKDAARKGRMAQGECHKWLPEERDFVHQNWRRMTDRELAAALTDLGCNRQRGCKRTFRMVQRFRERAGLGRVKGPHPDELAFIRANWETMTDAQMAEAISKLPCNVRRGVVRPTATVRNMRRSLGLKRETSGGIYQVPRGRWEK